MPLPGLLPAPQSPQLGQEGTRPLQDCGTARSSPGSLPAKGSKPAPCGARNWSSTRNPCCKNPGRAAAVPQLLAGRGSRAAPETFCCHTPAAAPSPCGLQPSCGAQQQGQQQATMYAPHHARGRRLPTALSPRLKQVQRASSPRHIPPAPRPPGQPHTGSVPAPQPRGKGQGAAGRPKTPGSRSPSPAASTASSLSPLTGQRQRAGGQAPRRGRPQREARAAGRQGRPEPPHRQPRHLCRAP